MHDKRDLANGAPPGPSRVEERRDGRPLADHCGSRPGGLPQGPGNREAQARAADDHEFIRSLPWLVSRARRSGPNADGTPPDVLLDPWCRVTATSGQDLLFGFALRDFDSGGPAWAVSPVSQLDVAGGCAVVEGGGRHLLGRQMVVAEVPERGLEARFAFEVLVSPHIDDQGLMPATGWDRERQIRFIENQKLARRLGLERPVAGPTAAERILAGIIEEMAPDSESFFRRASSAEPIASPYDDPSSPKVSTPVPR